MLRVIVPVLEVVDRPPLAIAVIGIKVAFDVRLETATLPVGLEIFPDLGDIVFARSLGGGLILLGLGLRRLALGAGLLFSLRARLGPRLALLVPLERGFPVGGSLGGLALVLDLLGCLEVLGLLAGSSRGLGLASGGGGRFPLFFGSPTRGPVLERALFAASSHSRGGSAPLSIGSFACRPVLCLAGIERSLARSALFADCCQPRLLGC